MPRIVRFHEFGDADTLKIDELPAPEPGAGEVRLAVDAFALNRADVMFRENRYIERPKLPSRLGYDAAGTVDAVGEGVTDVEIGDKVLTYPAFSVTRYGVYGESAVVPAHALLPWPQNLSAVEAAAVGVQYMTGYFGLFELGKLGRGQHILITAASSSTGVAALQLAKAAGATVIATSRTSAKRQQLLDLGADHVVATGEEDLVEAVRGIAGVQGVEVVYDPIGGATVGQYLEVVAPLGQIILYGLFDPTPAELPVGLLLWKSASIHGYKVFDFTGHKGLGLQPRAEAVHRAKRFFAEHLAAGSLLPVIAKTFQLDQIGDAHRFMESNAQVGKIVVTTS